MDSKKRVLFFPHSGKPKFMKGVGDFKGSDFLAISETLFVLYDITHNTPNAEMAKFGYIFSNIPGNAVLISENGDSPLDIPLDILKRLPGILKKDDDARSSFRSSLLQRGGQEVGGDGYSIIIM